MAEKKTEALSCSFCGKSQTEVKLLIAGPAVQICNECVAICVQIITENIQREAGAATVAEEGKGKKKEKRKAPKKEAATTVEKPVRQPGRTGYRSSTL